MSYFSDTADFRWNQACIVDLGAAKFPIRRVGGGGQLRKICSLWYNLTKKVVFLTVAGFGIFRPHKILGGGTPPQATRECTQRGGGTHHQLQTPARGGGEPHPDPTAGAGEGPRHTAPAPTQSRQTKPRKARTGTQTHHQHTAHTPTRAHNTHRHSRHRHEPHKRTPHSKARAPPAPQTHTTHENPKNKNPATPRQGNCRAAGNTARTQG